MSDNQGAMCWSNAEWIQMQLPALHQAEGLYYV